MASMIISIEGKKIVEFFPKTPVVIHEENMDEFMEKNDYSIATASTFLAGLQGFYKFAGNDLKKVAKDLEKLYRDLTVEIVD